MKKSIKKILGIVLMSSVIMTALAGCASKPTDTPASSKAETKTETKGAVAELTFWDMVWGPAEYVKTAEGLVAKFNSEHPNIKVTYQSTPWANFYQTFMTAVTSKAAPDVSTGAFPQAVQFAAMGEILPLDSIVEEYKKEGKLDDFYPYTMDLVKYDGHQVAIPWNLDSRQIFYRKDIFEQAGIKEMPKTWDDFIAVSKQIKEKTGMIPFTFAAADQGAYQVTLNFLMNNGTNFVNEKYEANFESDRAVQTIEFFKKMNDEGILAPGTAGYKGADAEKAFEGGKVAMVFISSSTGRTAEASPELKGKVGVLPVLQGPSGDVNQLVWPNSIMAYSQSKHPEEAKVFLKWWIDNQITLWTEGHAGSLPARKSYAADNYFKTDVISSQIIQQVIPHQVTPVWPAKSLYVANPQIEGENIVGIPLQEVLTGKTDIKGSLKKINDKIKEALEANKK